MARERPARHADRRLAAVRETFRAHMAGRAREGAVCGQALVVEQRLAKRALCLRIVIGCRERDRGRTAEFLLQRREVIALRKGRDAANERTAQERTRNQPTNGTSRPSRSTHINLPTWSSIRDTSLS